MVAMQCSIMLMNESMYWGGGVCGWWCGVCVGSVCVQCSIKLMNGCVCVMCVGVVLICVQVD